MGRSVRHNSLNSVFFEVQRVLTNMNNLALAIFICVLAISLAEVTVNLCNGGTGCCGTGMHTASADGSYTGTNDHTYVIYDPRADSLEDWDNWNLIYIKCWRLSRKAGHSGVADRAGLL